MRNKKAKILVVVLMAVLILSSIITLFACDNMGKTKASKIEVVGGTLKHTFMLDEQIDYSNARIYAYFRSGKETIQLRPEMVSGFNSSTTKENAMLTITFASVSVDWLYSVVHEKPVDTSLRVKGTRVSQEERSSTISVTASGLSEGAEMNSIIMTISCTASATIDSITPKLSGFSFVTEPLDDRKIKVILFAGDGFKSIKNGDVLLEVRTTVEQREGTLYIMNIESANAEILYKLPDAKEIFIGVPTQ